MRFLATFITFACAMVMVWFLLDIFGPLLLNSP